jgi:putative ABC transport system permease protein
LAAIIDEVVAKFRRQSGLQILHPLAFAFCMELMLQEAQHYHAPIGVFEIVTSLAVVVAVGLRTIFSQTWKAANTNPVDNLRVE